MLIILRLVTVSTILLTITIMMSYLLLTIRTVTKIILHERSNTNNNKKILMMVAIAYCAADPKLVVVMSVFWLEVVCLFVEERCHLVIVATAQGIVPAAIL